MESSNWILIHENGKFILNFCTWKLKVHLIHENEKFILNFQYELFIYGTSYCSIWTFPYTFPFSCIKIHYEFSIFVYQNSIWTFHFHVMIFVYRIQYELSIFHVSKFNMNFPFSCIKILYELSIFVYQNPYEKIFQVYFSFNLYVFDLEKPVG